MPTTTPVTATPSIVERSGKPFSRVLLKLSGESLGSGGSGGGLDNKEMELIAKEVKSAAEVGAQIAIVIGGGNFIRGAQLANLGGGTIHQATADYMGMLATIINGMALKEALKAQGMEVRVMSAIDVKAVAEPFIRGRALRHLEKGRIVVLVAGTGNPFCTTDTCAALRASELDCQVILKATKVDGIYTADPRKDPNAKRLERLTYRDALTQNLAVMDMTAFAMCQERKIPIVVFDYKTSGNIRRVVAGERVGTVVTSE
ncbi:MAG: UMP kinase [Phycisphaerales bacterium]